MRLSNGLLAFAVPALVAAQARAVRTDDVTRLEQQRIEALRTGGDLDRFYSPVYRGITAAGQPESRAQIQHTPNTDAARHDDAAVELHGDTAIVTGIEGNTETGDRDRILRILDEGQRRVDDRRGSDDMDRQPDRRCAAVRTAAEHARRAGLRAAHAG